jgi:hypothetical protein
VSHHHQNGIEKTIGDELCYLNEKIMETEYADAGCRITYKYLK